MQYADARIVDDRRAAALSGSPKGKGRAKPGEFVADELALMLREQPYTIRCLLARSRRLAAGLPTVWQAFRPADPDTGEVTIELQRIDGNGEPVGKPLDPLNPLNPTSPLPPGMTPRLIKRPRTHRIGIVVPIASLLGATDTPGELADRSGFIPGEVLKELIADALDGEGCEVVFTRLLTDNGGRLLDVTELGRYPSARLAQAVRVRAGTCRFPTCTVPADRCDIDHHKPVPHGPTAGWNTDPFCRRHHRGKTFAWQAALRDHVGVDWTHGHRRPLSMHRPATTHRTYLNLAALCSVTFVARRPVQAAPNCYFVAERSGGGFRVRTASGGDSGHVGARLAAER